jgi:hypothetical protein
MTKPPKKLPDASGEETAAGSLLFKQASGDYRKA